MTRTTVTAAALTLILAGIAGCGSNGGDDGAEAARSTEETSAAASVGTASGGDAGLARDDLVLCPAIEPIAADLASLAGFEPEGGSPAVEAGINECHVRGEGGGFVTVSLVPAVMPSIEEHAASYAGEVSAAPELGEEAVVIADATQPHVVYELYGHIIDVGMENLGDPPDRTRILQAGRLVRGALLRANGS